MTNMNHRSNVVWTVYSGHCKGSENAGDFSETWEMREICQKY